MAKTKTTKTEIVEPETTSVAEVVAESEASPSAPANESKERKQTVTAYIVNSLPAKRDKLAPQMSALVTAIEQNIVVDGELKTVIRSNVFESWQKLTKTEAGEKVFASYMHQMISFDFLDRKDGGEKKEKKVTSPEDRKKKILAMLAALPEEDRKKLLTEMG